MPGRLRAALALVLTTTVIATLAPAASAAGASPPPIATPTSVSAQARTTALMLWRLGGPVTKRDAQAALLGRTRTSATFCTGSRPPTS